MKNYLLLVLAALVAAACTAAAQQTAAEVGGAVVTGAGALVAFVEALRPMLDPEQAAKLSSIAANVEGTVGAVTQALGQIAEAVAKLKADQAARAAGTWTEGEIVGVTGAATATAVAASRVMSHFKHKQAAANGKPSS